MLDPDCTFCQPENRHYILENKDAGMLMDIHPVTPGHALIICKQHYATYFDVPQAIMTNMNELVQEAKKYLDAKFHPDGYNIGINIGPVGGQRIMHCHIHLMPRYRNENESGMPMQRHLPPDVTEINKY